DAARAKRQGVPLCAATALRRTCHHALAHHQGREAKAAGGDDLTRLPLSDRSVAPVFPGTEPLPPNQPNAEQTGLVVVSLDRKRLGQELREGLKLNPRRFR